MYSACRVPKSRIVKRVLSRKLENAIGLAEENEDK